MSSDEVPARSVPRWMLIVAGGAGVLLVVGGAVTLWRSLHSATFGWFAYSPLSETVAIHHPGQGLGVSLLVGGALVLGAVGGFVVGRRTR